LATLAAIGAAFSPAAPTGLIVWDAFLKGALAFAVVVAVSGAARWAAIVFASIAAGAVGLGSWVIPAWVALLISIAPIVLPRRNRALAALSAAIAIQVLLRLPAFGFFGLPSVIAATASSLVVVLGYKNANRRSRRTVRVAAAVSVVVLVVAGVIGGLTLYSARNDVEQGVAAARRGLEAARLGDTDRVTDELGRAERLLNSAADRVDSPVMQPLRLVPVISQHHSALKVATAQGALVASEAGATVRSANLQDVSVSAGRVDIDALAAMATPLQSTALALQGVPQELAKAESPWLLPVVADRIEELTAEIVRLQPEADLAAEAAAVVPHLLGVDRERSYLVLFGTPAESREFGGFVGSWALVQLVDGQILVQRAERISSLYALSAGNPLNTEDLPPWFADMARPTTYPQNLTSSPDFGVISSVAQQVLAGVADEPVDGYIYMDTWSVLELLSFTGPLNIGPDGEPMRKESVAELLFFEQYRLGGGDRQEVFDDLARVASAVVSGVDALTLPGPEELGRVLGPMARAGRIQMITFDETENDFLRSVKLLRDFDQGIAVDFAGMVQNNSVESKLDLFLHRSIHYDVVVAADGALTGTSTVELRSIIPDDAPPVTLGREDGTAIPLMSLYTPHAVTEVRIDGVSAPFAATQEFGFQRFLVEVRVPPTGETVTLEYDIAGSVDPSVPYDVKIWHQPLVNNDQVRVTYTGPDGEFDHSVELVENMIFSVDGAAQE